VVVGAVLQCCGRVMEFCRRLLWAAVAWRMKIGGLRKLALRFSEIKTHSACA
jgi:hypothetical protein